jgi:hypothetical protein
MLKLRSQLNFVLNFLGSKRENQNDDSDIQYLEEINRFEESYVRKKRSSQADELDSEDESTVTPSKRAFIKEENDSALNQLAAADGGEISCFQNESKNKSKEDKTMKIVDDDDIIELVKPIEKVTNAKSSRMYKTNSFAGLGSHNQVYNPKTVMSSNNSKSNLSASKLLNDSIDIVPLNHPNSGFSYQYDGLGGRKKVFKYENQNQLGTSSNKISSFFKTS